MFFFIKQLNTKAKSIKPALAAGSFGLLTPQTGLVVTRINYFLIHGSPCFQYEAVSRLIAKSTMCIKLLKF